MNDLINRQAAINYIKQQRARRFVACSIEEVMITILEELPSVQQEIIRCGDCKFFDDRPGWQSCQAFGKWFGETEMSANDFCSKAERREDG